MAPQLRPRLLRLLELVQVPATTPPQQLAKALLLPVLALEYEMFQWSKWREPHHQSVKRVRTMHGYVDTRQHRVNSVGELNTYRRLPSTVKCLRSTDHSIVWPQLRQVINSKRVLTQPFFFFYYDLCCWILINFGGLNFLRTTCLFFKMKLANYISKN